MPLKKITDLTDIGTPASDDLLEIVDVSDTTDSPEGTSKKVLVSALGGGGGVTEFIELTDVPASYTGQGTKVVAVKVDETGLEFVAGGGGSSPFTQEANGAIHRADVDDASGGTNSTNLTFYENSAIGEESHADSNGTANGDSSHADSNGTTNGDSSHADTGGTANGSVSRASGQGSIANSYSETVVGCNSVDVTANDQYAFNAEDLAFSIGIGASSMARLTSFSAYKNGAFKFISRLLSNITNAGFGFFAFDENARPNTHDGTQWNPLAYLSEITNPPDATPTVKGIAKLYTSLGSNTDGAVDQNTVNSALALKANLQNVEQIIRSKANGTFGSHTGDTAETVIEVIDIDANEFEAGDWMTYLFETEKIGSLGNLTLRIRAGLTGTTADALIATSISTALFLDVTLIRKRNIFLTGNLLSSYRNITSASNDDTNSPNKTTISLNPANDWKLTITAQLGSSGETVSLTGYRIGKIKSF